jgi:hypothetical protein
MIEKVTLAKAFVDKALKVLNDSEIEWNPILGKTCRDIEEASETLGELINYMLESTCCGDVNE